MANNLIGNIEHFDPKVGDIVSYMERMEQLFVCNVVEEQMKVSMLLTLIGGEAYSTLKDILTPDLPSAKSYDVLKTKLVEHFSPKRLQIAERYKFWNAIQDQGDDIKAYVKKLKSLSVHCKFGAFLQEAWRDKFVCGIRSQAIKRKLLSMDNLTFDVAVHKALSMKLAEGQVKSMNMESPKDSQKVKPCYRCGFRKHDPEKCPEKAWECFKCKIKGHISRACRSEKVNKLDESEETSTSDDDLGFLATINESQDEKPSQITLNIEG
ncbi:uncharacterized protein [Diabrotica undecimpunctata]|uniref:uncharacterized protein n=1 Tax=Diabrotica undecimpunctata TaxID=50387 RepID=UPI003B635FD4